MTTHSFLTENFLLQNKTARTLYHDYAKDMPIYDYHCHLPADLIARNYRFSTITEAWLQGDHYKWRAMRANGIAEREITGDASDKEKFLAWARTVPATVRNPLFHWTLLELKRYFDVDKLLNAQTAEPIYTQCNQALTTETFRVQGLLKRMNVKLVCTTEDPLDTLIAHRQLRQENIGISVHTAFRPDRALSIENNDTWNQWVNRLSELTQTDIQGVDSFLEAIAQRHSFFHENGCRLSDYGLETVYSDDCSHSELCRIFSALRQGHGDEITQQERLKFKSAMLHELAVMDAEKEWALQLHIGPLRNTNTRLYRQIGPDAGADSIGDQPVARPLARFLDRLDQNNRLPKTILYNHNPRDNAVYATMCGNFQDGTVGGKIQHGAAWWFLDQKEGIEDHLNTLSQMGILSTFVGMLTDSRSFFSFPRHEYFRRILCNLIGSDIERGLLPDDLKWLGGLIQNLCYTNAKNYFSMTLPAENE